MFVLIIISLISIMSIGGSPFLHFLQKVASADNLECNAVNIEEQLAAYY